MRRAASVQLRPRRPRRARAALAIWRVHGRDDRTGGGVDVGYLVTTAERRPIPLAFVNDATPDSLVCASSVKLEAPRYPMPIHDLRASGLAGPYALGPLLGMFLYPQNRHARELIEPSAAAAAMFAPCLEMQQPDRDGWSPLETRAMFVALSAEQIADVWASERKSDRPSISPTPTRQSNRRRKGHRQTIASA